MAEPEPSHLDLIAKLLRQAEGTTYAAEAEAFLSRAQVLATRHSIDLAVARAHTARANRRERPVEETITIGEPGRRGLAQYVRLLIEICSVNDVECLVAGDSTRVYAYGFASDIEVARALFASLLVQMVQAGDRYLRGGGHRGATTEVYDPARGWVRKPVHGASARRSFYQGYTATVSTRLRAARDEQVAAAEAFEAERESADAAVDPASGRRPPENLPMPVSLVLVEKQAEVTEFFDQAKIRLRVRGSWAGERRQRAAPAAPGAHAAGRRAGHRARLGDEARGIDGGRRGPVTGQ